MAVTGGQFNGFLVDSAQPDGITNDNVLRFTYTVIADSAGGSYDLTLFDGSDSSDGGSQFPDGMSIAPGSATVSGTTQFTITLPLNGVLSDQNDYQVRLTTGPAFATFAFVI